MSSLGTGAGTWRSLEIIDEFCQFFELSENIKKQLEGLLPPNQSTVSFILDLMQDFFETLKPRIANQSSLDLRYLDRDGTEDRDDKLLNIYVACMQLGRAIVSERSSCLAVFNTHVPRKTKEGYGDYTGLKKAFHRSEEGRPAFLRIYTIKFPLISVITIPSVMGVRIRPLLDRVA